MKKVLHLEKWYLSLKIAHQSMETFYSAMCSIWSPPTTHLSRNGILRDTPLLACILNWILKIMKLYGYDKDGCRVGLDQYSLDKTKHVYTSTFPNT